MRSLLYLISVLLIVGWLLGVFYWDIGGMIHILIILAVIFLLFGLIRKAR
ncbi:MAG TPA: lmo0937 family membrane protein [Flavisolibacter sp.]